VVSADERQAGGGNQTDRGRRGWGGEKAMLSAVRTKEKNMGGLVGGLVVRVH